MTYPTGLNISSLFYIYLKIYSHSTLIYLFVATFEFFYKKTVQCITRYLYHALHCVYTVPLNPSNLLLSYFSRACIAHQPPQSFDSIQPACSIL